VSVEKHRTIAIGPLIGLAGGVLLFVSLFLEWYESESDEPILTAFTVFEVLDLVLAALAIGAVVALAESLGVRLPSSGPPSRARLGLPLGAAALLLIVFQLLNDPPFIVGSDRGPELGLWLALAGALLIVAGGLLSVARISLALDIEQRRAERRQAAEPPATESEAPTAREPDVDPSTPQPPAPGRTQRPGPGPERRG
jgi:peptidoglycan/LPS O-acetylase OafA/YrhL